MAITTYAELQSSIASWLNRSDLTSVIPDFISLAETNMERSIRHWRQEKRATATIDTQYSALPADYLEGIRFNLDGDQRLIEMITSADMQRKRYANADTSGSPRYFSVTGGQLEVFPTPDAEYTGELYYYSTIDALSDSNTSNWFCSITLTFIFMERWFILRLTLLMTQERKLGLHCLAPQLML